MTNQAKLLTITLVLLTLALQAGRVSAFDSPVPTPQSTPAPPPPRPTPPPAARVHNTGHPQDTSDGLQAITLDAPVPPTLSWVKLWWEAE